MHALFDSPGLRRVSLGEYPLWDAALALLNRDLAGTLPEQGPMQLVAQPSYEAGEPEYVYVALANGEWHGTHLYPKVAEDLAHALAIVADAAQDTVAERLRQACGPCASNTTWACMRARWRGSSPGGAPESSRVSGRPTSVRTWARSTPPEPPASPQPQAMQSRSTSCCAAVAAGAP